MNPISAALKGKGLHLLFQRAAGLARSYGLSSAKIESALQQFVGVLQSFECSATFPVVSVVLGRNPQIIQRCQEQGMEFALHGYRHVDHRALSGEEQLAAVASALQTFDRHGIVVRGFRGPYLHANTDTLLALQQHGLAYDCSQALSWDVVEDNESQTYRHALDFYGALSSHDHPSLPSLEGNLVRMPYNLPDDEALVHRLSPGTIAQMSKTWLAILRRSHELGELFTLGLHPERIALCHESLAAVLALAHRLFPSVWIARLDEIATWWKARAEATVTVVDAAQGSFWVTVDGPAGTTLMARGLEVEAPTMPWCDGYQWVEGTTVAVGSAVRPFVGLSPKTDPEMSSFLRQQGYVVEISEQSESYGCYLDQTHFAAKDQRPLLTRIESIARAIVRLGRWPNGARSALAISGDLDAVTLWDYGFRLLGH